MVFAFYKVFDIQNIQDNNMDFDPQKSFFLSILTDGSSFSQATLFCVQIDVGESFDIL